MLPWVLCSQVDTKQGSSRRTYSSLTAEMCSCLSVYTQQAKVEKRSEELSRLDPHPLNRWLQVLPTSDSFPRRLRSSIGPLSHAPVFKFSWPNTGSFGQPLNGSQAECLALPAAPLTLSSGYLFGANLSPRSLACFLCRFA